MDHLYLCYNANSNSDTIRQNVLYGISAYAAGFTATNTMIYNNIILSSIDFTTSINNINGYIINNDLGSTTLWGASFHRRRTALQNNILIGPCAGLRGKLRIVYFNNLVIITFIPLLPVFQPAMRMSLA